jgi:hypothetical protein
MAVTYRLGDSAAAQRPRHARGLPASPPVRLASHHSPWRKAALIWPVIPAGCYRQSPAYVPVPGEPERENRDEHFPCDLVRGT